MSRVVVKKNDAQLEEASASCPVNCFKKNNNEYVIDPNCCIDCGVCQSIVAEGVIVEDSEADQKDIDFNNEKSAQWTPAQ